ncbi:hypothetical protein [Bacteroides propionicifaciens]|nr:hypothetical protein [Bacteroides propionicifaciens]
MIYKIVMKDEKGKPYFYSETYRTKAEAESAFELLAEDDEKVVSIVEAYE